MELSYRLFQLQDILVAIRSMRISIFHRIRGTSQYSCSASLAQGRRTAAPYLFPPVTRPAGRSRAASYSGLDFVLIARLLLLVVLADVAELLANVEARFFRFAAPRPSNLSSSRKFAQQIFRPFYGGISAIHQRPQLARRALLLVRRRREHALVRDASNSFSRLF